MPDETCDIYPDIHQPVDAADPDYEQINAQNEKRKRLYTGARAVLRQDFCGSELLPADPADFPGDNVDKPGGLTSQQVVEMATVMGVLNVEGIDVVVDKVKAGSTDVVYHYTDGGEDQTLVLDKRFVEQVVKAIQEFATASKLFQEAHKFLQAQGKSHKHPKKTLPAPRPAGP